MTSIPFRHFAWALACGVATATFAQDPAPAAPAAEAARKGPPVKGETVVIPTAVPFSEAAVIPDDIRTKCNLPAQQTEALSRHLKNRGFTVATEDKPAAADRLWLDLRLANASESGNRVLGRGMSVSLSGTLRRGEDVLGNFTALRTSNVGPLTDIMGSCEVLYRCNRALAEDVVLWLEKPSAGARLGELR